MGLSFNYQDGQTPITPEEELGLKDKNVSTLAELNLLEQQNIEIAVRWMLGRRFSAAEVLTEEFLLKFHQRMFRQVWKWAGKFRRTDKNIGVPWYEVPVATRQLCQDTLFWVEHETYPPEEIAIRFKHRLVSIHCFPNGNGRHSRLLADLIVQSVFGKGVFNWRGQAGMSPDEQRREYILALQSADRGEMDGLINFAKG